MFKFDRIIKQTLILIVITCFSVSPSLAKTGKGELKLSKDAMEVVLMYMYGAGNKKYSGNAKRKNKPTRMEILTCTVIAQLNTMMDVYLLTFQGLLKHVKNILMEVPVEYLQEKEK